MTAPTSSSESAHSASSARRWIPSARLAACLALPLALAGVGILSPQVLPWVWLLDAGILALLAIDAWAVARYQVQVHRSAPAVMFLGHRQAIDLEVTHPEVRTLTLWINDDVFDSAQATGVPAALTVPAATIASLQYVITPTQRGNHLLGDHHVRIRSPLGLWLLQRRLPAQHSVRVYPLAQQLLHPEGLVRGQREPGWLRQSRALGGESEFSRLRDYNPDDEYRSIDWKTTARRRRLTAREYQVESDQQICVLLDCSRPMASMAEGVSLLDHAIDSSLMLAQVAQYHADRVGLLAFDERLGPYLPPTGGKSAPQRLMREVYDLEPALVDADYELAFRTFASRFKQRCLLVLFTEVMDESVADRLLRHIIWVSKRHLPLLVLFRHPGLHHLMSTPANSTLDWYVRGAAAELLLWRRQLIRRLRQQGALVLEVHPHQLTTSLVRRYLEIKARHWL